ncbi:MAG: cytochrome C6 [Acaryochloridaceae cyanobacterium RL_2_7]|nr:cytochrome C6 [Acaryochloridaceae cyanobacterium RL_2_7]
MLKAIICLIAWIFGLILSSPQALADETSAPEIFEAHCSGCHLNGGNIIRRSKNLKLKTLEKNGFDSPDAIAAIVSQGKNNMSAFSEVLTAPEIAQVSDYVWQQAQQNWPS